MNDASFARLTEQMSSREEGTCYKDVTITSMKHGSYGFAETSEGEAVFVPANILAKMNVDVGYRVGAILREVDDPEHKSKYRMIRFVTGEEDVDTPTVIRKIISAKELENAPFTAADAARFIGMANVFVVENALINMHMTGLIAKTVVMPPGSRRPCQIAYSFNVDDLMIE